MIIKILLYDISSLQHLLIKLHFVKMSDFFLDKNVASIQPTKLEWAELNFITIHYNPVT